MTIVGESIKHDRAFELEGWRSNGTTHSGRKCHDQKEQEFDADLSKIIDIHYLIRWASTLIGIDVAAPIMVLHSK